jgi:hypothetical protein
MAFCCNKDPLPNLTRGPSPFIFEEDNSGLCEGTANCPQGGKGAGEALQDHGQLCRVCLDESTTGLSAAGGCVQAFRDAAKTRADRIKGGLHFLLSLGRLDDLNIRDGHALAWQCASLRSTT